jgi:hypothetical protein
MPDLLPNSLTSLLNPADHLRAGRKVKQVRKNAKGIVLTESSYCSGRNLHSWAVDQFLVDRVTQRNVRVLGAFVLYIADRGKTGLQGNPSIGRSFERAKC